MPLGTGWFIEVKTGAEIPVDDHAVAASQEPVRFGLSPAEVSGLNPRSPRQRIEILRRVLRNGFVRVREHRGRVVFEFDWPETEAVFAAILSSARSHGYEDAPAIALEVHDLGHEVNHLLRGADLRRGRTLLRRLVRQTPGADYETLVLSDEAEEGWNGYRVRRDDYTGLGGHFRRLRSKRGMTRGGLLVFSSKAAAAGADRPRAFDRIVEWLRGAVPELIGGIGEHFRLRTKRAAERLDGVAAISMRLGDAVRLRLIQAGAQSAKGGRAARSFDASSPAVWVAGLYHKDLETLSEALKRDLGARSVMFVVLDRREAFIL